MTYKSSLVYKANMKDCVYYKVGFSDLIGMLISDGVISGWDAMNNQSSVQYINDSLVIGIRILKTSIIEEGDKEFFVGNDGKKIELPERQEKKRSRVWN